MSFEYYISLPSCKIQNRREPMEFMRRVKTYGRGESVRERLPQMLEQTGKTVDEQMINVPFPIQTLLGPKTEISVTELMETSDNIKRKASPLCRMCEANPREHEFGCYGSIHYPLSEAGEVWAMDHFTANEMGYLVHHIGSSGVTGEVLDSSRGPMTQQPPFPLALAPQSPSRMAGETKVTFSMIWDYLLACAPELHPQTMFELCREFRAVEVNDLDAIMLGSMGMFGDSEKLDEMKSNLKRAEFRHLPNPDDDQTVAEFKSFLRTCWTAYINDLAVFIDG